MDAARAVEMAGDALARNSTADRAERERRTGEENHGAENERFLVERTDDIEKWFAGRGGLTGILPDLRAAFDGKTRTVFLRTGDLAASQNIALADLRREGLPEAGERTPGETKEFDLLDDKDHGVPLADKAASDGDEGGGPAGGEGDDQISAGEGDDRVSAGTDTLESQKEDDDAGEDGDGKDSSSPNEPDGEDPQKPDIKWKPEKTLFKDTYKLKVKGPIKVEAFNPTLLGFDGIKYAVDWFPLDKNGKTLPEFRKPGSKASEGGGHLYPFQNKPNIFEPPYDNPHGFEALVHIPPGQVYNANSAGPYLNIFAPEGGLVKERKH